ncbi:hypothetical protein A0L15_06160 [Campylobacter jejuni]|nr:hypothetical protein A0N17_04655 [Campylobacter jejuni]OEY30962.1 hypothetical protein A0L15_06160 [Campylobacter jejuni]
MLILSFAKTRANALKTRINKGWIRITKAISFICALSIFLPKNSGVLPIINAQINTVKST